MKNKDVKKMIISALENSRENMPFDLEDLERAKNKILSFGDGYQIKICSFGELLITKDLIAVRNIGKGVNITFFSEGGNIIHAKMEEEEFISIKDKIEIDPDDEFFDETFFLHCLLSAICKNTSKTNLRS